MQRRVDRRLQGDDWGVVVAQAIANGVNIKDAFVQQQAASPDVVWTFVRRLRLVTDTVVLGECILHGAKPFVRSLHGQRVRKSV